MLDCYRNRNYICVDVDDSLASAIDKCIEDGIPFDVICVLSRIAMLLEDDNGDLDYRNEALVKHFLNDTKARWRDVIRWGNFSVDAGVRVLGLFGVDELTARRVMLDFNRLWSDEIDYFNPKYGPKSSLVFDMYECIKAYQAETGASDEDVYLKTPLEPSCDIWG